MFFQASTRTIRATAQLINSPTQTVNSPKLMGSGHPYSPVLWIQPIPESEKLVFFYPDPTGILKKTDADLTLTTGYGSYTCLSLIFFFLQDCGKWKMFFNSLERTWMVQDQDGKNCGSPIYCYSSNIFTSGERGKIGKRQRISVIHINEIFPVRLRSYCS